MTAGEFDSSLLTYQKARQIAMNGNQARVAEIAKEHALAPAMRRMLASTINDWPKDKPKFFETMQQVCLDEAAPLMARALAAEHASSCFGDAEDAFDAEGTVGWSLFALQCVHDLDEIDGELLTCKVRAGLIDRGLVEFNLLDKREIIEYMVKVGSYDAPGRVVRWIGDFEAEDRLELLELVCAMDPEDTAANLYYLEKCKTELAELKG